MSARRHFGGGESPEPDPGFVVGQPELADPLARIPAAHAAVDGVARLAELLAAGASLGVVGSQNEVVVGEIRRRLRQ